MDDSKDRVTGQPLLPIVKLQDMDTTSGHNIMEPQVSVPRRHLLLPITLAQEVGQTIFHTSIVRWLPWPRFHLQQFIRRAMALFVLRSHREPTRRFQHPFSTPIVLLTPDPDQVMRYRGRPQRHRSRHITITQSHSLRRIAFR